MQLEISIFCLQIPFHLMEQIYISREKLIVFTDIIHF